MCMQVTCHIPKAYWRSARFVLWPFLQMAIQQTNVSSAMSASWLHPIASLYAKDVCWHTLSGLHLSILAIYINHVLRVMTLLCITCVRHECNHVPEVAFKTLGDLAYMCWAKHVDWCNLEFGTPQPESDWIWHWLCRFCTSSLITNGSIYYDLLLHARRVLETKLKIVYSPSETELIEYQGQGISDVYTKPVQDNTNKDYVGGVWIKVMWVGVCVCAPGLLRPIRGMPAVWLKKPCTQAWIRKVEDCLNLGPLVAGPRFQQEDSTSGPSYQSIELLLTLANGVRCLVNRLRIWLPQWSVGEYNCLRIGGNRHLYITAHWGAVKARPILAWGPKNVQHIYIIFSLCI